MKKTALLAALLSLSLFLSARDLWDGSPESLTLREGAKLENVSVRSEDGVIQVSGKSEGDAVTYITVQVQVAPFSIAGKALALEVWSDTPADTTGFYVRGLTADNREVLSFQKWGFLKQEPQKIVLLPESSAVMKWEAERIKAPLDSEIAKLRFYIGARGDGKEMTLHVKDLQLVDAPKTIEAIKLPGKVLRQNKDAKAVDDGGVITAVATGSSNTVTYFDFNVPLAGDLTGKSVRFSARTTTPQFTKAFYVRGYNRNKECILSFRSWDGLLGVEPRLFNLTPGKNSSGMAWEPKEVAATDDRNLAYLRFYIGTRGNAGEIFDGVIENLQLSE